MYVCSLEGCCGVKELIGIGETDPDGVLRELRHYADDDYGVYLTKGFAAHLLFTSVANYGQRLADFIADKKLGPVVRTDPKLNPNSGNLLTAWLWTPDWNAIADYLGWMPAPVEEDEDDDDEDDDGPWIDPPNVS